MEDSPPKFMAEPLPDWVAAELVAIWSRLAARIGQTAVQCQRSGNCCNFDEWDHVPFATTLELRHLASQFPQGGQSARRLCPYWVNRACTAHAARPTGCRVFFCDTNYQAEHAQCIYEQFHKEIQTLCDKAGIQYAYVPMVPALRHFAAHGRWFDPANPMALLAEA